MNSIAYHESRHKVLPLSLLQKLFAEWLVLYGKITYWLSLLGVASRDSGESVCSFDH
jgi:hypothetical protein